MSASIKDVAKLAGVSTATVSHVINNTRNVKEETKNRVYKAISVLNYSINPLARSLRSGTTSMIAYVVSNLANYFYMDIARNIGAVLSREGYNLLYIDSYEDPLKERKNIENMMKQSVDGFIIAPVGYDCSYMNDLIGDKCPAVFIDRKPFGFDKDCIMSTNYQGAYNSVKLLTGKGHTRIGFIASRFDETMHERLDGYKAAIVESGLTVHEEDIQIGDGKPQSFYELKHGNSYELTRRLMEKKKVTAIFVGNNISTIGVFNYLKEKHYGIPGDVALVTFDDAFWISMSSPTLTVMDQNLEQIGHQAAGVLLSRIKGSTEPFKEYRIPTSLIVRESC